MRRYLHIADCFHPNARAGVDKLPAETMVLLTRFGDGSGQEIRCKIAGWIVYRIKAIVL